MADITLRDVDEAVIEAHRRRAEARGVSLEEELRDALSRDVRAAKLTREELLRRMDECRALTPPGPRPLAEDVIREMRGGTA